MLAMCVGLFRLLSGRRKEREHQNTSCVATDESIDSYYALISEPASPAATRQSSCRMTAWQLTQHPAMAAVAPLAGPEAHQTATSIQGAINDMQQALANDNNM